MTDRFGTKFYEVRMVKGTENEFCDVTAGSSKSIYKTHFLETAIQKAKTTKIIELDEQMFLQPVVIEVELFTGKEKMVWY